MAGIPFLNNTSFSAAVTVASTLTVGGDALVEDNIYLTDGGTVRGKIQLNSSDRDNLDIKAISLGSLMRFYTVDTLALTLDASQNATFAGEINLADNKAILFGGGGKAFIKHDGSNFSLFNDIGDITFTNRADNKDIIFQSDDGSGGVATYFKVDPASDATTFLKRIYLPDNVKAQFGNSSDLKIYHDGSNSFIQDTGTGDLYIDAANNFFVRNQANGEVWIKGTDSGVSLRFQDSQKLITTTNGVTITGGAVVAGGMSSFETTLTNNNDYTNSPISILERDNIGSGSADDKYSPNLNFHWGGRVSNSLWMQANGNLNYGSYTSGGVPALDGTFAAGNFIAALNITGNTGSFTGQVTGPAPSTTTSFANKAYVDAHGGGIGPFLPLSAGSGFPLTGDLFIGKNESTAARQLTIGEGRTGNGFSFIDLIGDATYTDYGLRMLRGNTGPNAISVLEHRGIGNLEIKTNEAAAIVFETTATERIRINSTGNVGIGTTMNINILDVGGVINVQGGNGANLTFNNGDANITVTHNNVGVVGRDMSFKTFKSGVGNTEKMRITRDGNVGIGTPTPQGKLHVKSANAGSFVYDTSADDLIVESNANGGITIATAAANTSKIIFASPDDATGSEILFNQASTLMKLGTTTTNGILALQSGNGSEAMRIDSSGNVGIGTTSPNRNLHVIGQFAIDNSTSPSGGLLVSPDGTSNKVYSRTGNATSSAHPLDFISGSSTSMRITSTGNVGIATTTPGDRLTVNGNIQLTAVGNAVVFATSGAAGSNGIRTVNSFETVIYNGRGSAGFAVVGNSDIRLGFGTAYTAAQTKLTLKTTGVVQFNAYNSTNQTGTPTYILGTDASGNVVKVLGGNIPGGGGTVTGTGTTSIMPLWTNGPGGVLGDSIVAQGTQRIQISSGGGSLLLGQWDGSNNRIESANRPLFITSYTSPIKLGISGSTTMTIESSNVGIGTTTPVAKLDVFSAASFRADVATGNPLISIVNNTATSNAAGTATIKFTQGNTQAGGKIVSGRDGNYSSGATRTSNLQFYTSTAASDTEKMRITSAGNVLINHTAGVSETKLYVEGSAMPADGDPVSVEDMLTLYRYGSATVWAGGASLALGRYFPNGSAPRSRLDFKLKEAPGSNTAAPETTVMTMQSNGHVGIGTTAPGKKLEVVSNTTYDGIQIKGSSIPTLGIIDTTNNAKFVAYVRDSDATIGTETNHPLTINTNNSERMRITSGGNVGIGTTTPGSKLEVITSGSNSTLEIDNSDTQYSVIQFNALGAVKGFAGYNSGFMLFGGEAGVTTRLQSGGNYAATILTNGNFGIGTTSPGAQLEVRGVNSRVTANSTADGQFIGFQAQYLSSSTLQGSFLYSTGGATLAIANHFGGNNANYSDIYFQNCNNGSTTLQTRMTIKGSSGFVGIGTTSPQNTLHLGDNTNSSAGTLRIDSFVANQFWKFEPGTNTLNIKDYDGTSLASFDGANNYVLFNGGNVGINTTGPSDKLEIGNLTNYTGLTVKGVGSSRPAITFRNVNQSLLGAIYGTESRDIIIQTGGDGTTGTVAMTLGSAGALKLNTYTAGILISDASGNITTYGGTTPPSGLGAAGRITIWDNATELGSDTQLNWDFSNNRLGIGLTNPSATLELKGATGNAGYTLKTTDTSSNETFFILDGGRAGVRYSPFSIGIPSSTSLATNAIFQIEEAGLLTVLDGTGGVGIGTSAPSTLSSNTYSLTINSKRNDLSGGLFLRADGTDKVQNYWDSTGQVNETKSGSMRWFTGNTERMRILSNGNIGIGTTSPGTKLTVEGDTKIQRSGNDDAFFTLNPNSSALGTTYQWNLVGTNSANNYQFQIREGSTTYLAIGNSAGGNAGNVGIGTTSPTNPLSVEATNVNDWVAEFKQGHSTAGQSYGVNIFGGTNTLDAAFQVCNQAGDGLVRVNGAGNVGIGATGIFTNNNILNLSGTGIAIKNDTNGSSNNWSQIKNTAAGSGSNLVFLTATGTNIMDDSGQLGIGTTSPGAKLDVVGPSNGSSILKLQRNGVGDGYAFAISDAGAGALQLFSQALTSNSGYLWQTKNSSGSAIDALFIDPTGRVGIGTNTPAATFAVKNLAASFEVTTTNDECNILSFDRGNTVYKSLVFRGSNLSFNPSDSGIMMDVTNAGVSIGTTTSIGGVKLNVDGNVLIKDSNGVADFYLGNYATANHFRFHTNNIDTYFDMNCGNLFWRDGGSTRYTFFPATANMTVNGTITQNSDVRVKENIVEISDCISKVQAMRGVYYNRTDFNTEATKVGVIAQEVEAVLPELIVESPEDGLKSVAYSELTAVLINAIKEQQEIIEDLKTRVKQLENK